jgi:hypothetical protein
MIRQGSAVLSRGWTLESLADRLDHGSLAERVREPCETWQVFTTS